MGEMEAIGDLATGGVLARAAEPSAGEANDGHTHERNCLNCGCALVGDFCHCCGQQAHVHRTIGAFFHDLAHGVFHFEGKIWRTLPMLVWHPGRLTRRYIDGQRASFVSPIALFLFSVFLMFAVVNATGNANPELNVERDLGKAERNSKVTIKELMQEKEANKGKASEVARIEKKIQSEQEDLKVIQGLRNQGIAEATFDRTAAAGFSSSLPWIEEAWQKGRKNPELLLYKVKSDSYKWSWAIIPLSVPFLWLLFPFSRRFRTYDHVVFVTYSLCFMTLLVAAGTLLAAVGAENAAGLLMLVPPIHMYRQLRGAYGSSRIGAALRTLVLSVAALIVLAVFVTLMVGMSVSH
ncbi:DUF3667 domain-containing protein [Sphingomonas piscis]|uniref:DUF3667 domain-containing protein n=1 Tax=Sphingomonas piscis TaxID=2714943 RepID=A0A6G7YNT4_9SPHN|nr:DUF3667 domain-containing protein [Sphingomonas piscis]QIK78394.1 DUF3667 domain-containing protein [Sphingomonas piscis]